jgi:hypothetical protein
MSVLLEHAITVVFCIIQLQIEEFYLLVRYACDSCKNRRFGGTERLHHQGDKNRRARNVSSKQQPTHTECSSVPPKRRFLQEPHAVTSQKTVFFIVTSVKTSNLTQLQISCSVRRSFGATSTAARLPSLHLTSPRYRFPVDFLRPPCLIPATSIVQCRPPDIATVAEQRVELQARKSPSSLLHNKLAHRTYLTYVQF